MLHARRWFCRRNKSDQKKRLSLTPSILFCKILAYYREIRNEEIIVKRIWYKQISSNDKDTTMHLEIYAPEYKAISKAWSRSAMEWQNIWEDMWNLQSILPAADTLSLAMTSSATDTAPHQDHPVCTLMTGTTQLKICIARKYVVGIPKLDPTVIIWISWLRSLSLVQ